MATPLRFRRSPEHWTRQRVVRELLEPLDSGLGARMLSPWYSPPDGWTAHRFEMNNGDIALFARGDTEAYWIGNTETPSSLWRTEKYTFREIPELVAEWAERELLAQLYEETPWLAEYPAISRFFLPVFLSKDGRDTSREFFRDHAAGFPDTEPSDAATFYENFLKTGAIDDHRYVMAGKLGTSEVFDSDRMSAAMAEFNAAKLLIDAGYTVTPEAEVTTGHSIDFRVDPGGILVEVTRPSPPASRTANTPVAAVKDTAETKTGGQLQNHGGGVTLFVDCSSFPADAWAALSSEQPDIGHRPAVVFRMRPTSEVTGYTKGSVPMTDLGVETQ